MKRIILAWGGDKPPIIAIVALFLTLGVLFTTPVTLAKYATNAEVISTGVNVAHWNVTKGTDMQTVNANNLEVWRHDNGTKSKWHTDIGATRTFSININVQTATDIIIKPTCDCGFVETSVRGTHTPIVSIIPTSFSHYAGTGAGGLGLHGTQFAWRYDPGFNGTVTFTITFDSAHNTLSNANAPHHSYKPVYHIDFIAQQVD